MKKLALIIVTIILLSVTLSASNEIKEAVVSPVPILLNGEKVQIGTYLIEQEHYFKLRDLAALLKDTDFKFNIGYDKESQSVIIESNKDYNPTDKDLKPLAEGVQKAIISPLSIIVNDNKVDIKAYLINKNNYVKLRDFSELIGFYVGWNKETKSVEIRTIDLEEKSDNTTVNTNNKAVEIAAMSTDDINSIESSMLDVLESVDIPVNITDINTPENQQIIKDNKFDGNYPIVKINDKVYELNPNDSFRVMRKILSYFGFSDIELTTDMPEKFIATSEEAKEQVKSLEERRKINRELRKNNEHYKIVNDKVVPHDKYNGIIIIDEEMIPKFNLIDKQTLNLSVFKDEVLKNLSIIIPYKKPYSVGNLLDFLNPFKSAMAIYEENILVYDKSIGGWQKLPDNVLDFHFINKCYFTETNEKCLSLPQSHITDNIYYYLKCLSKSLGKPEPIDLQYLIEFINNFQMVYNIKFE